MGHRWRRRGSHLYHFAGRRNGRDLSDVRGRKLSGGLGGGGGWAWERELAKLGKPANYPLTIAAGCTGAELMITADRSTVVKACDEPGGGSRAIKDV